MKLRGPDFYLLLKQKAINGQPPRYFFNHIDTRPSYEKKKKFIKICGIIDPKPDFIGGKLLSGKQKAIGLCNQLNARLGRIKLREAGHQTSGSHSPPSERETARLLEKKD